MSDLVTIDIKDHVADVRLNRPEKMNAVNPAMWKAIYEAGASLEDEREVRAVVLSGNGRAFCAGLDMESMQGMVARDDDAPGSGETLKSRAGDRPENTFQRAAIVWKRLPMPVIGAIHGVAFGAGAQIALGADIRFMAPDVRFSILEIKWGLIPDVGISQTLREIVSLDDHELAARLSYFLWGTMPDAALQQAASEGLLSTPEGLEAEARRMLDDPRSMEIVTWFFEQWLELDHLDHAEKDREVYPDWTDDRPASFREETLRFVRTVWEQEAASFETLLTADWTIADAELAEFYGYGSATSDWGRVSRDPAEHAGILTQGAFLASRARSYASSPIHRGMFIRGAMLCHVIDAPDASLEIQVPQPDPEATTRELLEQHRADPTCAGCHNLIDPPGLAFEHFDGIGRWRSHENGLPVDASTELAGTDVNGFIDGAADLGAALTRSTMVHQCFARQWFRFAHGRRGASGDACEIDEAAATFAAEDLDMRSLVLATVRSPAFRFAMGSPCCPAPSLVAQSSEASEASRSGSPSSRPCSGPCGRGLRRGPRSV